MSRQPASAAAYTIGRFELRRHLGRGAMGDVELVWDPRSGREVALKWMRLESSDPDALAAERQGAELQRRVAEIAPQVAGVWEYGELDDDLRGRLLYVAMEYVDGVDLVTVLRDQAGRALALPRALHIADELLSVLATLHEYETEIDGRRIKCVLHGDIKPENLRLQPGEGGERLRILDFGVAKHLTLTRQATRNLFGSYPYTPPERLRTGMVDERSDLWAAGVILYQMLAGRSPYAATSAEQLERELRTRPATPLGEVVVSGAYPDPLLRLVDRSLAFDAQDRFSSAREMREALRGVEISPEAGAASPAGQPAAGRFPPSAPPTADEATRRTASTGASEADDVEATRRTAPLAPVPLPTAEAPPGLPPLPGVAAPPSSSQTRRTVPPPPPRSSSGETRGRRPGAVAPTTSSASGTGSAAAPESSVTPAQASSTRRTSGRRRRRLPRWLWIGAMIFLVLQYSAHNAARSVVAEVTSEARPDVDQALSAYRFAARMRPFDLGLGEARRALRGALVESAEQVIAAFSGEAAVPRQRDWQQAHEHLRAAIQLGRDDDGVRARLHYTQAHDDRIAARSAWNERDRDGARNLWNRSIQGFERAAELDPEWPDPYLGLARIHAYEVFDLGRLEQALRSALGRGYTWADREKAQLADAHRTQARRLVSDADELRGSDVERERDLLLEARDHLALAVSMYEQIPGFGNAAQNRDLARTAIDEIEQRLGGRRRL
ncbi:MAG: serine/threonine protein kinase [Acidobacteria bacterium]|nr:MAG: serine/threonine protein kinase [Acidobacteriota bacterium]